MKRHRRFRKLDQAVSTLDQVKGKFTLLVLVNQSGDTNTFRASATQLGVPLNIVTLNADHVRDHYGYDMLLVPPDQHVAWRRNRLSESPENLLKKVTGRQ